MFKKIPLELVLILLTIFVFAVYFVTSNGESPYNYFTRLAGSFLHGKYYLDENPSWLNELVPVSNGKYAVVYPPAPAIVSMPFVLIFGQKIEQQIISQIMGALSALIWGVIAYKKTRSKKISLWFFMLTGFGTITWFMSATGSVWYMGQISAYLFLSLTIYESIFKKRPINLGVYFGLAVLSRLQVILALPLIFYLNRSIFKKPKNILIFIFIGIFFGSLYALYNFLRFGSITETGYSLIPGVLKEPWFNKGIFSLTYIPSHLGVIFESFPIFTKAFPFIKPSWGGLSIWITSPVFVYAFLANLKKMEIKMSWISVFLIALVVMSHGTTGFAQFGYRFAVDFYPIILYLMIDALPEKKLAWHHYLLLSISIAVNLWGVIWINKFGWVSF